MTYTFKLSRRLAVARAVPVCVLALAACDTSDPFDSDGAPWGSLLELSPVHATAEPHQKIRLAFRDLEVGDLLPSVDVAWTVTGGGSISPDGSFTATEPGVYYVVGKKGKENASEQGRTNGNGHKVDTSIVVVVPPPPALAGVELTPAMVELAPGGHRQFEVVGRNDDGSTVAIGVEWSATGGTIDDGGYYIAGATAGSYRVIARHAGTGLADTASVEVVAAPAEEPAEPSAPEEPSEPEQPAEPEEPAEEPSPVPTASRPNEPSGYTRFAEMSFDGVPGGYRDALYNGGCDLPGILAGCVFKGGSNWAARTDDNAPASAAGVLQLTYREGLQVGDSPGLLQIWDAPDEVNGTEYRAIYEAGWFKMPGSDFEIPGAGMKLLGYWGVGQRGVKVPNQVYIMITRDGSGTGTQSSFNLSVRTQNHISRAMSQNTGVGRRVHAGRWHRYEIVMKLESRIGANDGVLQLWIDGVKTHDYHDVQYRTAEYSSGFYGRRWDPIFGGMGGDPKSRDDYLWIDHVYLSGIRK